MRKIKNIILHCSDSEFGNVKIITDWHKQRGWRTIGYSYVICSGEYENKNYDIEYDGLIEGGRDLNNDPYIDGLEQGAHAKYFNRDSIGICLIGKDKFTPKQFESLTYLIKMWEKMIPDIKVIGHYEINKNKSCPNINMDIMRSYLSSVSNMSDIQIFFNRYLH